MHNRYETLLLLKTETTSDELSAIESRFEDFTSQAGGEIVSFDNWGKYRLAYPVNKNDYGLYALVRYNLPQGALDTMTKELSLFFKIKYSDSVIRFVNKKLDDDAPKEYIKPEPVATGARKNLDSFIKENKMEGMLSAQMQKNRSDSEKTTSIQAEKKHIETAKTEIKETQFTENKSMNEEE